MGNRNIQGPIPLEGRGMIAKARGDYKNGEFKRLSNVVLDEGRLVNRRNIRGPLVGSGGIPDYRSYTANDLRFIGFHNHLTIYASQNAQYAYDNNGMRKKMFAPKDIALQPWWNGGATSLYPVGTFIYNNRAYWIMYGYDMMDGPGQLQGTAVLRVLSTPEVSGVKVENYSPVTFTYDTNSIVKRTIFDSDWKTFSYVNHFVFKDRLWMTTPNSLQFSVATDPGNFSVDEGAGFFNFNDDTVMATMAVKDNIYIICKNSVKVLTYENDPNEDATIRSVTDSMGGSHGCIHRDTPFFINKEGIFQINNLNVEKAAPAHYDYGLNDYNYERLVSYENSIIVHKSYLNRTPGSASIDPDIDTTQFYTPRFNYIGNNPSFEGQINGQPMADWSYGNFQVTVSTSQFMFGSASGQMSLTATVTSPSLKLRDALPVTNPIGQIPLQPDQIYTLSWYFRPGSSTYSNKTFAVQLPLTGADGSAGTATVLASNLTQTTLTGTWRRWYVTFKAPKSDFTPEAVPYTVIPQINMNGSTAAGTVGFIDGVMLENNISNTYLPGKYFPEGQTSNPFDPADPYLRYGFANRPYGSVVYEYRDPHDYYTQYYPAEDKLIALRPDGSSSSGNVLGYNTYMINTDNGNTTAIDYRPIYNTTAVSDDGRRRMGFICDAVYNPNINPTTGTASLFMLTATNQISAGANFLERASNYVVYMEQANTTKFVNDTIYKVTGNGSVTVDGIPYYPEVAEFIQPKFMIEIDSFTPDGNEYLMKKFRHIEIMAKLPSELFEIAFGYDNEPYTVPRQLIDTIQEGDNGADLRPHYPHRVGINQRTRALSVLLGIPESALYTFTSVSSAYNYDRYLEISDIRTQYAYTQYQSRYASGSSTKP